MMMTNVSHEYKTPLNAIITSTQLNLNRLSSLADQVASGLKERVAAITEQVKVESTSSELMLCLVKGMIDMGHLQISKLKLSFDTFTARDLVSSLKNMFKLQADQKRLKFEVRADSSLTLRTDRQRLTNVLVFLLSNSFKFTHRGSVALAVARLENTLQIEVRDSGRGISEQD